MMNGRAVSPMLGVTLLLGLTLVVALGMLVIGLTVLGGTQSTAETRQIEQSLGAFAGEAKRIAQGDASQAAYRVQVPGTDSVTVDEDAGSYEVRVVRANGTEVLTNGSLGAYRVTRGDGTTVAYQGGGVWRRGPGGEPRLVSPPPFHYRTDGVPTLTLPVVRVAGTDGPAPTRGTLAVDRRRVVYPVRPSHENPLDEGVVYVSVASEYCAAWEEFFVERTDGSVDEGCSTGGATSVGEVRVELSVPLRIDGIRDGIWTGNADVHKNANVSDLREGGYDAASVDVLVAQHEKQCEERGYESLPAELDESRLYCAADITHNLEVDTDEAGGDVEIYSRAGMEDNNDIDVSGSGGTVSVYFDGSVDYGGGHADTTIGNEHDPTQTRLFFNSSIDFYQAGDGNIYGLVYAPESPFTIHASGSGEFVGAIVAESVDIGSASVRVEYDEDFRDVVIEQEGAGEPFYYLHVSETTLRVENRAR